MVSFKSILRVLLSFIVLLGISFGFNPIKKAQAATISTCGTTISSSGTYTISQNLTCSGTVVTINASNVILDLGGKTVIYDTSGGINTFGIYIASNGINTEIKNGTITQSTSLADSSGSGSSAIRSNSVANTAGPKIHDLTINTHTIDARGIRLTNNGFGAQIYNNTLNTSNLASVQDNGNGAIEWGEDSYLDNPPTTAGGQDANNPARFYNNIINGSQCGFWISGLSYVEIYGNQIHQHNPQNGKAGYAVRDLNIHHVKIHDNIISTQYGMGIVLDLNSDYNEVYNNYLEMSDLGTGAWNSEIGLRFRHGGAYNKMYHNTVIVHDLGSTSATPNNQGANLKAFFMGDGHNEDNLGWPHDNEIYENYFEVSPTTPFLDSINRAAVFFGVTGVGNVFRDNIVKSDVYLLEGGETLVATNPAGGPYPGQAGGTVDLRSNIFIKGDHPASGFQTTILYDSSSSLIATDTKFLPNSSGSYAYLDSIKYGDGSMVVKWFLDVTVKNGTTPVSGASIQATGPNGENISGTTDSNGYARLVLDQIKYSSSGNVNYTPHTITVSKSGFTTKTYSNFNMDSSKDMVVDLSASINPPLISKVTSAVDQATNNVTITWTTDRASDSKVDYGTSTSYGQVKTDSNLVTNHSIQITGLSAGVYNFRVISKDSQGENIGVNQTFFLLGPTQALTLTKSADKTTVRSGDIITYAIQYNATVAANNVVITDQIPARTSNPTAISNGGTVSGGVITWNLGNLAAGATGSLTFNVTAN